jgi:CheY-like chemotaxis protein
LSAKLLHVEDNPQHAEIVRRIVMQAGYEIVTALDGMEGVALAQQEYPDLILLDINMPMVNGIEVAQRIRAIPELAAVPIIALTTNTMHGDREYYLQTLFNDYVAKPILRQELLNTIQKYVRSGS